MKPPRINLPALDSQPGPAASYIAEMVPDREIVTGWPVRVMDGKGIPRTAQLVVHAIRGDGNDGGVITLSLDGVR
jgi:hypothetical protein